MPMSGLQSLWTHRSPGEAWGVMLRSSHPIQHAPAVILKVKWCWPEVVLA